MTDGRWYAVTTQPRHEKLVTEHLQTKSIEAYLPLLMTPSRWKDRVVSLERPIFPGYVFVRIDIAERHRVLGTSSVVRMLAFGGVPAVIEDSEIEAVRLCLTRGSKPVPHPFLAVGEHVRVKSGVLAGLEGIVTRNKNQCRIVVSISLIQNSIAAEVEAELLEPLDKPSAELKLSRAG